MHKQSTNIECQVKSIHIDALPEIELFLISLYRTSSVEYRKINILYDYGLTETIEPRCLIETISTCRLAVDCLSLC
jgi:hypothetical protein